MSRILFTAGSTWAGTPPPDQVHPPGTRFIPHPWDQVPPWNQTRYTPLGAGTPLVPCTPPPGPGTPPRPGTTPPPGAVHAGRYGQQACGTHPTGMHSCLYMLPYACCRFCDTLNNEEGAEHDRFLEECISDPTLRDKMSILSRTFQNRRKVTSYIRSIYFRLQRKLREGNVSTGVCPRGERVSLVTCPFWGNSLVPGPFRGMGMSGQGVSGSGMGMCRNSKW